MGSLDMKRKEVRCFFDFYSVLCHNLSFVSHYLPAFERDLFRVRVRIAALKGEGSRSKYTEYRTPNAVSVQAILRSFGQGHVIFWGRIVRVRIERSPYVVIILIRSK
jgi:hypothetical protein